MTQEQFQEIKNSAWAWYRGNMLEWAIETIRNLNNAPQWVKDCLAIDLIVCPSMDEKVFELAHKEEIETILRESQRRHFELNYLKELHEYFEARLDSNEYEMVDALCDMIVVCLNAGAYYFNLYKPDTESNLVMPLTMRVVDVRCLVEEVKKMGYDPYKCLTETIKELETRTGAWNEAEGKWCKHNGAYTKDEARDVAKKLLQKDYVEYPHSVLRDGQRYWQFVSHDHFEIKEWYKSDYAKCKLQGVE